ncbi:FAD/NAD(P)-binding protein [Sphingomonas crocodyli]|uniref:FAD-dependent oxidoreductase n=1 Tax=Sphingomonas crocodyli TaxID=1979270 RepID=A0A437MAS6_9SPHN|nr:FAD/NAD(P)-binding protein [Sphingomonas crocodyli]RVT94740.1 FAD-dependent oxidoreductase [Sphingomonas crocodyli]
MNAPPRIDHVAVIGAGFSGTLQAINLLRHDGPRVTLIERRDAFARGVAYSTATPEHLLNVRASNMSALPDDPDHFVRWLAARGKGQPQSFASRCDYGDYLAELLAAELRANPGRLTLRQDEAISLDMRPDGVTIAFADGSTLAADAAVLALGNLPPHDPPGLGGDLPADLYARDPWGPGITDGLTDDDTVLIIGTGLTMIDMVLALDAKGFRGPIVALSRRGLAPHAHGDAPKTSLPEKPVELGSALVHRVRARAREIGWRSAIDELRPYTQAMWLSAPPAEQRRFLRHLRAWWDIHRHRLSPQVAEKVATLRASGRLRIVAGKLQSVDAQTGQAAFRPRHRHDIETIAPRRIINCTGPQGDLLRTGEPLLKSLVASGHLRPDPLHLGIDVNAQAETIDATGKANPRLIALGPMTRGAFWEIVAVPDIRMQTWSVARRLSHAQWVGGEGL